MHGPVAVFPDLQADILPSEVFATFLKFRTGEIPAEVFPVGEEFGANVGDAGEADGVVFHVDDRLAELSVF